MKAKILGLVGVLLLSVLAIAFGVAMPALATSSASDNLTIVSAKVFKDYKVSGDWLVFAEVTNTKTPYFTTQEPVGSYWVFQLMGTDNTTVYGASPLNHWDDAPVAIYLAPAQVSSLTYGGSTYKVQVKALYTTVNSTANYTMTSSDWIGSSKTMFDLWVKAVAARMNNYYGYTGTSYDMFIWTTNYGLILSAIGGGYLTDAEPNITQIRKDLFEVNTIYTTAKEPGTSGNVFDTATTWTAKVGADIASDMTAFGAIFVWSGRDMMALLLWVIAGGVFLGISMVGGQYGVGGVVALFAIVPFLIGWTDMRIIAFAWIGWIAFLLFGYWVIKFFVERT